jgi:ribulose-phosphate 3-epimerase
MGWGELMRTVQVEPSLYAADLAHLAAEVEELLNAGARVFHFDVGDGHFVEPITMGPVVLQAISGLVHERGGVLDCHLMVDNPERHIPQIARAGGDGATFHAEVTDDPGPLIELAHEHGLQAGVAFKPDTAVEDAAQAAAGADLALCMSIDPGYSGQAFMPSSFDRIARLRELLPGKPIQVDGGIGPENVRAVREAGATLFVAGNAVFGGDDLQGAYRRLVQLAE